MKWFLLTILAMVAFAANSVLARLALAGGEIDPLAYTGIRLLSGAVVLAALLILRDRHQQPPWIKVEGSWRAAAALFGYAGTFSIAYLMLSAATGALILFATVQVSIIGLALVRGDRPSVLQILGFVTAFIGLVYLLLPGLMAPRPAGAALMIAAGICWAVYTLLGRGSKTPLIDTAGNFLRCAPLSAMLALVGFGVHIPTAQGVLYALGSGVVASGLGYAIWYSVLPKLSRMRAGMVQLSVPAIAAFGGILFISEPLNWRLIIAGIVIIGAVGLALFGAEKSLRTKTLA